MKVLERASRWNGVDPELVKDAYLNPPNKDIVYEKENKSAAEQIDLLSDISDNKRVIADSLELETTTTAQPVRFTHLFTNT